MSIFNLTDEKMKETSSTFTAHEIYQQPATWRKTCAQLAACKDELQAFIDQVVKQDDFDIVLTGAGTSEFVGNSLFQALNPKYDFKVKSYASTDLVPSPENFLSRTKPTLLVNFGRSGNSPESLGNVEAAEVVCQNLYHLFVTCNHEGTLSKLANTRHNCFAINLTPETHDQSFAMTSSYSNMYLATYLAFNLDKLDEITAEVEKLAVAGQHFLDDQFGLAQKIVDEFDYNRIVYLGNIGLKGVAQESALKTLELTAGKVATMYDSELGFRHGPKTVLNDETLTVLMTSPIEHARPYDFDMIRELATQKVKNRLAVVTEENSGHNLEAVDYVCKYKMPEAFAGTEMGAYIFSLLFLQILSFEKSYDLKITTDNPCPNGEVNRVVQGIIIHEA